MNSLSERTLVIFTQLEPDAVLFLCAFDRYLRTLQSAARPKELV